MHVLAVIIQSVIAGCHSLDSSMQFLMGVRVYGFERLTGDHVHITGKHSGKGVDICTIGCAHKMNQ